MPKIATRLVRLALCAVVALVAVPAVYGQSKKSDGVVKIAAKADKADSSGVQTVTITLDVDKTWHTYANPVGNKDLDGTQTTVTFQAMKPVEVVKLTYPKGTLEPDKTVGDYYVYTDKVTITAQIKRAANDTSPLEAHVYIQACSTRGCLLPATVKVPVSEP
jgi:DsbC/DsbD-like thiol-disulfide interchange protein